MADGAPTPTGSTPTIEVILTSLDGTELPGVAEPAGGTGDGGRAPAPNWRRTVALASLAGAALGIVLAVVILDRDGDGETGEGEPPASVAGGEVTAPPTLVPLAELPPPDFATRGTLSTAPQGTTSQTIDLFLRDRYPRTEDIPGEFELAPAVAGLSADLPRIARTHLELGENGYELDVEIVRDPASDRYAITLDVLDEEQRVVVDVADDTTYVEVDDGWIALSSEELLADVGATDARDFFDRLLLGPLRPDTLDAASTEPGDYVSLRDMVARESVVAREYAVVLPGAIVPEWQLYVFSPIAEFPPDDRPAELTYTVYVTQVGELGNVLGTSLVGDVAQRIFHSIEVLDPPIAVEVPDPASIVIEPDG